MFLWFPERRHREAAELAEINVARNREALQTLRQENKQLRSQLAHHSVVAGEEAAPTRAIQQLEKRVHELRRSYDKVMQEKKTALAKLENLQETVTELNKTAGALMHSPAARRIRLLENRLDKAVTKANEAQSIQRSYSAVLDKLGKERSLFASQLKVLEEAVGVQGREVEQLASALREAQYARDGAKAELVKVEGRVAVERERRAKELGEQRAHVTRLKQANEAMLAQARAKYGPGAAAAARRGAGAGAAQKPSPADVQGNVEAVQFLLRVSGMRDIDGMLDFMLGHQESYENLLRLRAMAQEEVSALEAEVATLQRRLSGLTSASGKMSTQEQLDVAKQQLAAAEKERGAAQQQYEAVARQFKQVKAGVDHLLSLCAPLPLPGQTTLPLNDETVVSVVAQCYQRLWNAQEQIKAVPQAASMLDELIDNLREAFDLNDR